MGDNTPPVYAIGHVKEKLTISGNSGDFVNAVITFALAALTNILWVS